MPNYQRIRKSENSVTGAPVHLRRPQSSARSRRAKTPKEAVGLGLGAADLLTINSSTVTSSHAN